MSAPAGWHRQDDGRERYWDGAQWTDQFRDGAGPGAAPPDKKSRGKRHLIGYPVTGIVALLLGVGMGSSGDSPATAPASDTAEAAATPAATVTSTVTQKVTPAPAPTVFRTVTVTPAARQPIEEGVWEVGVDIPAGRYKVHEPITSDCYWQISPIGSGDIIDNGAVTGGRPTVILKKGQEFTNQGCGLWSRIK